MKKNPNDTIIFHSKYLDAKIAQPHIISDKQMEMRRLIYVKNMYVKNVPKAAPKETTIKLIYLSPGIDTDIILMPYVINVPDIQQIIQIIKRNSN